MHDGQSEEIEIEWSTTNLTLGVAESHAATRHVTGIYQQLLLESPRSCQQCIIPQSVQGNFMVFQLYCINSE